MNHNNEVFLRLCDLIFGAKLDPGTLATAIELHGIHTWDRYGRRRLFLPESTEAQQALDRLAAYCVSIEKYIESHDMDEEFDRQFGGDAYGWPADQAPDFNALQKNISTNPELQRPRHADTKSENASAGIIGGLLQYIKGELGNQKHPEFQSEDALIDHLALKLKGYAGLSKRNLKNKFALGKVALK